MAEEKESRVDYMIYDKGSLGQVRVADEVLSVIAGISTMEVNGVAAMAGSNDSLRREIISRLGMKVLSNGVHTAVENGKVTADISVVLESGAHIPNVTAAIQDKVAGSIETMTGLPVAAVNVTVADVKLEDE